MRDQEFQDKLAALQDRLAREKDADDPTLLEGDSDGQDKCDVFYERRQRLLELIGDLRGMSVSADKAAEVALHFVLSH